MITNYNSIFEQKLNKLYGKIKKLRKSKGDRDSIKKCVKEAKKLKTLVQSGYSEIRIDTRTFDVDSTDINLVSIGESGGVITIRFKR